MVSPTYKHLEAKLRIGPFSLGQWAQILVAAVVALLFGVYLSPLPATATIFVSIVLGGSPLALSYGAMAQEWSVTDAIGAQWRRARQPRCHLPGPTQTGTGYLVLAEQPDEPTPRAGAAPAGPGGEGEALWDL